MICAIWPTNSSATASTQKAKVNSGDTVYSILKRNGFNDNQVNAALSQNILPKSFVLSPGDMYKIHRDKKNNLTELYFFSKQSDLAHMFWKKSGSEAGAKDIKVNYNVKSASYTGRVRGSLIQSIANVVGDELVAYRFMDAYLLDYKLTKSVQKNARFSLEIERLYENGQFVKFGEITKTELELDGQNVVRYFKDLKEGGLFYGVSMDHTDRPLFAPVDYIRISSLYQARRYHPIKKYRKAHLGIDFELPEGEPVLSAGQGTILRTGRNRGSGNFVVIRHPGGYESYYNHLSRLEGYKAGQRVGAGTKIGEIGCTGYCTKPHLHFAVKKHGRFVNPIFLVRAYSYKQQKDVQRLIAQARR